MRLPLLNAPTPFLLYEGEQVGRSVGRDIAAQHWSHVHLIAHSAGAALIQAATVEINALSPATVIHTTFLDPYLGLPLLGVGPPAYNYSRKYGVGADWSDQYFTSGNVPPDDFPYTGGRLEYAYNVDVTDLNPQRTHALVFVSGRPFMTCYQPLSTHGWPIDFYTNTIPPNTQPGSEGLGFPLSKEGGDWQQTLVQYGGSRNNEPRILGNQTEICVPGMQFTPTPPAQVLTVNHAVTSTSGTVQLAASRFTASTGPATAALQYGGGFKPDSPQGVGSPNQFGSPAWVSVGVTVTAAVNFVSFDAGFTSALGAAGLLSVYWDTNLLGVFDERVIPPGLTNYFLSLPDTFGCGQHLLGFRLDPYTNITSSILVTNAALGFSGLTEPFSLAFTGAVTNGLQVLALTGPNYNYAVQASTNLTDWTPIATLVNTNGRVDFFDPASTNSHRFYRAIAP